MANTSEQLLSAFRRTDQAYGAQVVMPVETSVGMAYCAENFGEAPDADQIRETVINPGEAQRAAVEVDAFFAARGRRCMRWAPAAGESNDTYMQLLPAPQWRIVRVCIFGHSDWSTFDVRSARPPGESVELRILPARAMRRAFEQTFAAAAGSDTPAKTVADIAAARLDDSNYDVFVGTLNGAPVGRVGMLEVGDICRIEELHVAPDYRRRGVGQSLLRHVLRLAYRLRPRALVTSVRQPAEMGQSDAATALLTKHGFECAGEWMEWERA